MRIAVDATSLLDTRTGVGRFTEAVVARLAATDDLDVTLFPVSVRGRARLRQVSPAGARITAPPLPARLLRASWRWTGRPRVDLAIGRHDVVYGPNFVVPPAHVARVATVHDLTCVRYPELCDRVTRDYPGQIRRAAREGAWIHTVSHAVRTEVVDLLDVPPDRVVAIPSGVTAPPPGDPANGRRLAGHDAYVLAVGTVEPRKDLPCLVRAVDRLARAGTRVPVVHAGPDGWGTAALEAALDDATHPGLLTRLGMRTDQELADLYSGARLLAYPSVYEGFGFPVLEAMQLGTPVITTRVPAVAEVAGDAAVFVDVGDDEGLASAIDSLWADPDRREALARDGRARAGEFSWDRTVRGLVDLFGRAVAEHRPVRG